ncbi:MAG: peptidoglycan-binding protein, partial [Alphaproteobacteria bacterium]
MGTDLKSAVGPGKPNLREDVELVQSLLNKQKGAPPLKQDGRFGPQTAKAITAYQLKVLDRAKPDGVVDPEGAT